MKQFPLPPTRNRKSLALTLHDTLDNLEEFVLMQALASGGNQFEILSITPPSESSTGRAKERGLGSDKIVCLRQALLRKIA